MRPFPFVLFGKNLFEPVRLSRSDCPVHKGGIMKDDELLTATITPKSAHLLETRRSLFRLTLLDCHSLHRLIFYLAAHPLFSLFRQDVISLESPGDWTDNPVVDAAA
jgi:hypothetical protein